jgi:lipoic acid synthetase
LASTYSRARAILPVRRYVPLAAFEALEATARQWGSRMRRVVPLVRSSYHADRQALAAGAS